MMAANNVFPFGQSMAADHSLLHVSRRCFVQGVGLTGLGLLTGWGDSGGE